MLILIPIESYEAYSCVYALIFDVVKPHLSFYYHDWPKANGLIQCTADKEKGEKE